MYPELQQLLDWLVLDAAAVERGRQRQEAIWHRRTPDRPPILLGRSESRQVADKVGPQHLRLCEHQLRGGRPVPEYRRFDHYSMREQFENPRSMLIESLWDMIGWARAGSDAQLSMRPNYGVGTLASVFGCGTGIGEQDMPWVTDRPERNALLDIDLESIESVGLLPRVLEFIAMAREALSRHPQVHVFMPDLQGPMNIAFLLREQNVFFDMADDPAYFGRLMEVVCEVYIRLTRRLKRAIGEPLDSGYHGSLYMAKGGARVVDDVSVMLSPGQYEEFSLPYVRRCLAAFGGGWVHSCGDISHQLRFYLEAPEIGGVNFGEPDKYDFAAVLPRFAAADKFVYGGPVRQDGESIPAYLQRVAGYLHQSPNTLIFQPRVRGAEMIEGDWPDPRETLGVWSGLFK